MRLITNSLIKNSFKKAETTCFIVDAYHYKNHCVSDLLCHWWCNPAPSNGSAPNLVVGERDRNNNLVPKRDFNTQACEQLNSWLDGFESILKQMTQGNFNWFIHTMLFYHTHYVIQKQEEAQIRSARRAERNNDDEDNTDEEEDNL
ncbi:hypothetical protein BDQ12DRAFT_698976 [Crucibulum laeve]|uniref:Uncharacterized protein n=1 Tax=Crucibulum laeve TaxID=68775 RepID=A0A5C3M9R1_9AGAR|nr:hypothetical protein BDQ12DRAFT_698976 [Crucibulum laeve]